MCVCVYVVVSGMMMAALYLERKSNMGGVRVRVGAVEKSTKVECLSLSLSLSPLPPMSSSSSTALILGGRGDV